jgi:hypothetical protein
MSVSCSLFSCSKSSDSLQTNSGSVGVAGSYARFLTIGNYLYTVDNRTIQTFDLAIPNNPEIIDKQDIGENIETIYHLNGRLFIGSSTAMYVYTIGNNGIPAQASAQGYAFQAFACPSDPIVANDSIAFVTLNTAVTGPCGINPVNELKVFDVKNIYNPKEIARLDLPTPKGVGLDGSSLFVCLGTKGLAVLDVSNPYDPHIIQQLTGFEAFDVIPLGGLLLVVGPENVYQFDYSDPHNIVKISEIPLVS